MNEIIKITAKQWGLQNMRHQESESVLPNLQRRGVQNMCRGLFKSGFSASNDVTRYQASNDEDCFAGDGFMASEVQNRGSRGVDSGKGQSLALSYPKECGEWA